MHESDTYQAILDEGEVRGLHRALLRLGRKRFGEAAPDTQAALTAITDLDRLQRMAERLLDVAGWQDLLQAP